MSTIRVVNLQHTDATEPNIVLLADGTSVFASGITISGGTNLTVSGTAEFASGTVSAPGVTFIDDNNTGLYSPAADTVAITTAATERLRVDSSGNLLLGTTTNYADGGADNLVIGDTSVAEQGITIGSLTSSQIRFADAGANTAGYVLYNHSDNALAFGVTSERLRIDSSGLVNVTGGIQVTENVTPTTGSGVEIFKPSSTAGQMQAFDRSGSAWMDLILKGNTQQFHANGSERMRIDSSGRLGLGTSSPTTKLEVAGDLKVVNTGISYLQPNTITAFQAYESSGPVKISLNNNGSATFASTVQVGGNPFPGTATGFSAYIDGSIALSSASSTGTIFFGYTTGNSTPTTVITGGGSATFAGSIIHGSLAPGGGGGNYFALGEVAAYSPAPGNHVWRGWIASSNPNVVTSQIYANGNAVFAGTVTASNVSDIRFKENITDANPQLADAVALGLQLKNFDWNNDAPLNDELRAKRFLGLVAQEAEKVCPSLTYTVPRTKQGKELTPAVLDKDGNETKAATYEKLDDSYKAINHDILVMKLLGAVAELSAKVAVLENA